jgi:FkbM family methyltransferase
MDKDEMSRDDYQKSLIELRALAQSLGWLRRIRPQILAEPLYRLLGPYERRRIINWQGIRFYADPFSHLGRSLIREKEYEAEQCALIRQILKPGGIFLDIGANEGIFSAMATQIVGINGLVIAVEPQSRLRDVLEINIILNGPGSFRIYNTAISDVDRAKVDISLNPISNTGGSSIVHNYRWSKKRETATTRTIDSILSENNLNVVHLAKIDVEGFEFEVINSAEWALCNKIIKVIAVDYHNSILDKRGMSSEQLNEFMLTHGYKITKGDPFVGGYVVYQIDQ